ncbi:MAG: ABC transporter permease [Candidatus Dormibacteraeota bacterium]|nr:ABC transporter permease [Candidatus Dormibacteraeota bacterium]
MKRILLPALLLVAMIGSWELYVDLGGVDPLLLAAPHQIVQTIFSEHELLWTNFLVTLQEVVFGIGVAAVAGLVLAVLFHLSTPVRQAAYPLVVASQTIPILLLAPLLMLWLGFGILPKVIVIALVSFFSVVVATLDALGSVDPQLRKLMRTFDASRWRMLRELELPAALPGVFTGMRIAVAVAVIGAVLGETYGGSNAGLGYLFLISFNQSLTSRAYATVVILSLFAVLLFTLLTLGERLALPWTRQLREEHL